LKTFLEKVFNTFKKYMEIKKNYELAPLTTFKVSGRAEFFVAVKNKRELLAALNWAEAAKLPVWFFSGGSNILFSGNQVKGLVIKISGERYSIKGRVIAAWAGTGLTKLAKAAGEQGLTGLEWAYGVPGSLGGAVRGNAGAYGSEIASAVTQAAAYDFKKNKFVKLTNRACRFGYRQSIFKQNKNLIILHVKLKLNSGEPAEIKNLAGANFHHRLATKPKQPSAGCIFKNLEYKNLLKANPALARELAAKGLVRGGKIGVGYLIDRLGLKGKTCGGAKVSQRHANFIVNTGKATAADIKSLINLIKKEIKNKHKINLEEEIQYFGN